MIFTSPMLPDIYVPFDRLRAHNQLLAIVDNWRNRAAIMNDMPMLPLTPDELLTTTRTVRKRLDLTRPVPVDLVRECLEIALQAPSGSNRQGWHWVVITDENLRRVVGDFYRNAVASYLKSPSAAAALFGDDPERSAVQRRVGESVAYLGDHMGEVPVLVIPCIKAPNLRAGNQAGLWGSLLPAAWSYMLAARARGLGTAWTSLHLRYEKEISELIGIPADIRQGALIPTAYYMGDAFKPAPRQPLDSVLHVDGW
jgi:nitroreductase